MPKQFYESKDLRRNRSSVNRRQNTRFSEDKVNNRRKPVKSVKKYNTAAKNKGSGNFKNKFIFILICIVLIILAFYVFKRPALNAFYEHKLSHSIDTSDPLIQNGVYIMGEDYSGLTKEEAIKKLSKSYILPEISAVVIKSEDDESKVYDYSYDDLGISYDIEGTVDQAISFANPSLSKTWFRDFKILESGKVDFCVLKYDYDKIKKAVDKISKEINEPMKNAAVRHENNKFIVTKEVIGCEIDSEKLLDEVLTTVRNSQFGKEIKFSKKTTNPKWTTKDFMEINHKIGTYKSKYSTDDKNRVANLKNACKKLNGLVIYPGETLSTNDRFNPCTEDNGWKMAGTIVNGGIEDTVGGGMCQISSALYMASLYAELEIVERHNHSLKVNYMPYATDAALAGDYKDLKIKNDTDKPIYIEAYAKKGEACVNIYGKEIHDSTRKLEFEEKFISSQEPDEPVKKFDSELPVGTEKVTTSALDGQTYELYKKIYENGKLKDTVFVNTSIYSPRQEVISVGTKQN